jgi:hypothetical protein
MVVIMVMLVTVLIQILLFPSNELVRERNTLLLRSEPHSNPSYTLDIRRNLLSHSVLDSI